jgi:hypothetical protein
VPLRTHAPQQNPRLFDHLVGPQQERLGDFQPERLGRGQVDDEIEFGRLLDGNVGRLRTAKNFIDQLSGAPE